MLLLYHRGDISEVSSILSHCNDLLLSVLCNVLSRRQNSDSSMCIFIWRYCMHVCLDACLILRCAKIQKWPLRQVPTTVCIMWWPCHMTWPQFRLVGCWQIRSVSLHLRPWSSDRKESLPYPKELLTLVPLSQGVVHDWCRKVACQMNWYSYAVEAQCCTVVETWQESSIYHLLVGIDRKIKIISMWPKWICSTFPYTSYSFHLCREMYLPCFVNKCSWVLAIYSKLNKVTL